MPDQTLWQAVGAGYRRLAADHEEMRGYLSEVDEWTSADLDGLAVTAADDYPEYNQSIS
jgi:hypothetical protein